MKFLLSKKASDIETLIYLILFSIYLLFSRIVPIAYSFDSIDGLLSMGFAGIGCLLILQDLLTDRYLFKVRFSWVLFLFLGVLTISNILNIQYGWVDNLKTTIWFCIHFFVLYTMSLRLEKEKNKHIILFIFKLFNILFSISLLLSIGQFIVNIGYLSYMHSNLYKIQGFFSGRLFGIFSDPNAAAMISLCMIIFNMYLIKNNDKKVIRILYFILSFINFLYIVLSNSRTALIVCMSTIVFCFIIEFFSTKNNKEYQKKLFLIFFIVLFSFVPIINVTKYSLVNLQMQDNTVLKDIFSINEYIFLYNPNNIYIENVEEQDLNKNHNLDKFTREDLQDSDYKESRIDIWKGYLTSLKSGKWLFGLSPRNAIPYIEEHYPDNYIAESGFIAHSDYLAIIAYTGLAGFAVFVLLAVLILQYVFKKIRVKKKLDDFYIMSLLIVFSILVYGLSYRDILFCNTFTGFVFWLFMSYILNVKDDGIYEEDSTPSV